jgi:hypothetical protein
MLAPACIVGGRLAVACPARHAAQAIPPTGLSFFAPFDAAAHGLVEEKIRGLRIGERWSTRRVVGSLNRPAPDA